LEQVWLCVKNASFLPAFLISQKSKIFDSFPPGEAFAPHCGAVGPEDRQLCRTTSPINGNLMGHRGEGVGGRQVAAPTVEKERE